MIKILLRSEGLLVFVVSLYFYSEFEASWLLFTLLFFLPDISMIGYLKDPRVGAFIYNIVHNYAIAIAIVLVGLALDEKLIVSIGMILTSHIGLDRFLGFGLKYPSGFRHTHIQRV